MDRNERLQQLIRSNRLRELKADLSSWNPADVASFLEELDGERRLLVFRVLPKDLAAEVFSCIARTLAKMLGEAVRQTRLGHILLSGGVASSTYLREILPGRMERAHVRAALHWGKPELSGDNAAGVALIGSEWHKWNPND